MTNDPMIERWLEMTKDPMIERWLAAAEAGDLQALKDLLKQGVDINAGNSINTTALMKATRGKHLELIDFLLDQGADLNPVDCYGFTVMTHAVIASKSWNGCFLNPDPDPRPLQKLLAAGGKFRLCEAVLLNDVELARVRLEEGANPNTGAFSYFGTMLQIAATLGYLEIVNLLLEKGADPEETDDIGNTPLVEASENGHTPIVTCLLDHGAKIDAEDWFGQTPLAWAVMRKQRDVVALLLARGAKRTLLDAVALDDEALVEQELRNGANPNTVYHLCGRLADFAVQRGQPGIVRKLLERGAIHYDESYDQRPLLTEAARLGHVEIVRLLIEFGADLEAAGRDIWTPLDWATLERQQAVVDCLKAAGAKR